MREDIAKENAIADMQANVFRMAHIEWNVTVSECSSIFQQHNLFNFIRNCYDILHLSSYACALNDIEKILRSKGVVYEKT